MLVTVALIGLSYLLMLIKVSVSTLTPYPSSYTTVASYLPGVIPSNSTTATPFSTGAENVWLPIWISTVPPALGSGRVTITVPLFKSLMFRVILDALATFSKSFSLVIEEYLVFPLYVTLTM